MKHDLPPLRFGKLDLDRSFEGILSFCSRLELFGVLARTRELCCLPLRETDAAGAIDWCRKAGLAALRSRRRYVPLFEPGKANYSNVARFDDLGPDDEIFTDLLVSRITEYGVLAASCQDDARIFATLLGYPACCIDFFVRWYPKRAGRGNDYVLPLIDAYEPWSFLNNSLLGYFDLSLISHFPCSPCCIATREQSASLLEALAEHSPELAARLARRLKSVVLYTERHGIAYSDDYEIDGDRIFLNRFVSAPGTPMAELLAGSPVVAVASHASFSVGGRRFARNCRIARFC